MQLSLPNHRIAPAYRSPAFAALPSPPSHCRRYDPAKTVLCGASVPLCIMFRTGQTITKYLLYRLPSAVVIHSSCIGYPLERNIDICPLGSETLPRRQMSIADKCSPVRNNSYTRFWISGKLALYLSVKSRVIVRCAVSSETPRRCHAAGAFFIASIIPDNWLHRSTLIACRFG